MNTLCALARLFLSPYDLTPSYKDMHNRFSVRYYLNLVLVDEEDRRYFKQQVGGQSAWQAWAGTIRASGLQNDLPACRSNICF